MEDRSLVTLILEKKGMWFKKMLFSKCFNRAAKAPV